MKDHPVNVTRLDWFAELVRESLDIQAKGLPDPDWRRVPDDVMLRRIHETWVTLRGEVTAEDVHLGRCLGECIRLGAHAFFMADRIRMLLEEFDPDVRDIAHEIFWRKAKVALQVAVDVHENFGCGWAPAGEPCQNERAGAVAYIAHSLGIRREHLDLVGQFMAAYEAKCTSGEGECCNG